MPSIGMRTTLSAKARHVVGDAFGLAAEDEGDRLGEIDVRVGDGVPPEMGGDDLEARLFQGFEARGRRRVDGDLEPLVGPGRDGLVEAEELGIGGDEVEIEDAGRVARPDDRAGVVGDGHALEDDAQVGLALGQDALDLLDPLGCRHAETIAEGASAPQIRDSDLLLTIPPDEIVEGDPGGDEIGRPGREHPFFEDLVERPARPAS